MCLWLLLPYTCDKEIAKKWKIHFTCASGAFVGKPKSLHSSLSRSIDASVILHCTVHTDRSFCCLKWDRNTWIYSLFRLYAVDWNSVKPYNSCCVCVKEFPVQWEVHHENAIDRTHEPRHARSCWIQRRAKNGITNGKRIIAAAMAHKERMRRDSIRAMSLMERSHTYHHYQRPFEWSHAQTSFIHRLYCFYCKSVLWLASRTMTSPYLFKCKQSHGQQ